MSEFNSKSAVVASAATFDEMLKQFGVVTVMNARVYKEPLAEIMGNSDFSTFKAHDFVKELLKKEGEGAAEHYVHESVLIDTLKIANINMEGPTKTVTGGQYVNPLIKFGKTATIEMQDALGRGDVIELLGGGIVEDYVAVSGEPGSETETPDSQVVANNVKVLHMGQDFAGAKTILGESFFIERASGAQVKVYILLYEMLPDSIMNLTQDAEGDATVFDLNGSLSAVDILIGDKGDTKGIVKGVFYSILPQKNNYSAT